MRIALRTKRTGRARSRKEELRRTSAVVVLGAIVASATNDDVADLDDRGRVVAKNNFAGNRGSSIPTTKGLGGASGMTALIVECVIATRTVKGLEAPLHSDPTEMPQGNLVLVHDDHFGQSGVCSSRGGLVADRYK